MAFLDVLGRKISQTGQEVVQKTKDTAEVIKYNSMISDEEHRIDNLYNQIGKTYVELHTDSYEDAFAEAISGIKEAHAKISEYREHIIQVKGVFACPNCGEELQLGAAFCSACGSKMEKPEAPVQNTATRYCQSCGAPMQEGYVFCINCGAKYEDSPTASTEEVPAVEDIVVETPVSEEVVTEDPISE